MEPPHFLLLETGDSFPYRSSLQLHSFLFSIADLGSRGRTRRDSHPLREIGPIIPAVIPCFFIGAHRIKI
ncbi:hypothetical protein HanIR_Chr04g0197361 [Helianthus annuus]|nr:hypothetical protein HanIR_Chr04g0197361 [Helianthus annuus]